ncbi:hypothetical protein [Neisseria zalophi]|uniref:Uncharacterized protein n=1 Tax=Neisseria zalophi TaxID=640030 RepID=A0A5J6PUS0_9NEIS|nr:hypothetical protein [Neisseria zalophi]QEY25984.1 hypothetical protein D0T92_05175 [Neisseria zalophi]QEY25993.1 hypothetical protein D0T92_05230 [Neisseria zalophi]
MVFLTGLGCQLFKRFRLKECFVYFRPSEKVAVIRLFSDGLFLMKQTGSIPPNLCRTGFHKVIPDA